MNTSAESVNPYAAPSVAASEQSASSLALLDSRERRAVELFLSINRMVAGVLIGSAVLIVAIMGLLISRVPSTNVVGMLATVLPIAILLFLWGFMQAHKYLLAIVASGIASSLVLIAFACSIPALVTRALSSAGDERMVIPIISLIVFTVFCPPVWAAIRATGWVRRGVRLTDLAKT